MMIYIILIIFLLLCLVSLFEQILATRNNPRATGVVKNAKIHFVGYENENIHSIDVISGMDRNSSASNHVIISSSI